MKCCWVALKISTEWLSSKETFSDHRVRAFEYDSNLTFHYDRSILFDFLISSHWKVTVAPFWLGHLSSFNYWLWIWCFLGPSPVAFIVCRYSAELDTCFCPVAEVAIKHKTIDSILIHESLGNPYWELSFAMSDLVKPC